MNQANHGISFEEAATVFRDRAALSWEDKVHSVGEYRTLTLGYKIVSGWLSSPTPRAKTAYGSLLHVVRPGLNENSMSHDSKDPDEIKEQSSAPGGARGKYYDRYMLGSNVVVLAPDVAEVFHDSETVNTALREYLTEHGAPPHKAG